MANWIKKSKSLANISTNNFWWIDGNIFIDDVDLNALGLAGDIPKLKISSTLLLPRFLTDEFLKVFECGSFDTIIWPGNGSRAVKKLLGVNGGIEVSAKRIGYGANVSAQVAEFTVPVGKSIIVIDDVISSGVTALEVYRTGKLQAVSLGAWLMQAPRDSSLKSYNNIFVGVVVRGRNGRVPVNSLSTFIENIDVLSDYAHRYAENISEFMEFFAWLREEGVSSVV